MITGKSLKALRLALGYTGEQMAKYMYTTKQTISAIETGKTSTLYARNCYRLVILERTSVLSFCLTSQN